MGRAERRKAEREQRKWVVKDMNRIRSMEAADNARAEKIARIERNGITLDDLKQNWEQGFNAGKKCGVDDCGKTMFAAAVLALHEEFGFGADRCLKLINSMADKVIYTLTSEDIIDEVMDKVGISINLEDPLEPVKKLPRKSVKWKEMDHKVDYDSLPFSEMPNE